MRLKRTTALAAMLAVGVGVASGAAAGDVEKSASEKGRDTAPRPVTPAPVTPAPGGNPELGIPGDGKDNAGENKPVGEDGPANDDPAASNPGSGADPAPPALGRSVVAEPQAGTVLVRLPGSTEFVALEDGASLPVGSVIDASHGKIEVTAALAADGTVQTGTFWGGAFKIRQPKVAGGLTQLILTGPELDRCVRPGPRVAAGKARMASEDGKGRDRRRPSRHLWGSDSHGRFQTHGRDSVASVRGTRWLTLDTCAGTITRVTEGAVSVRDLGARRTVLVTAGQSYMAAHRPAGG
jgi:hypothetical protein